MFSRNFAKLKNIFSGYDGDPLENEKHMINSIQQFVGIRNVFGDKNIKSCTVLSTLSAVIFCGAFVYVGTFSQIVYLFQVLPDKVRSFQAMNCISATLVPLSKFIFMRTSSARLRKIVEMSREGLLALPEGSAARNRMMKTLHTARMVSWLVVINEVFTHLTYLLIPVFLTIFTGQRYLPTTPGDIYGIYEKYQTPSYEITFILTIIATMFSATNQTGFIVLFVTILCHELGHFYAISETLHEVSVLAENCDLSLPGKENNKEGNNKKQMTVRSAEEYRDVSDKSRRQNKIDELLLFCVKQHQFLIRFHTRICELYKAIFGAHFLIMVIVLVTTLQTLNSWGLINTVLTGFTGIMPLIVYCFGGELLITAGLGMTEAVYNSGWESLNVKQARTVMLMLSLSQYPLHYIAAGTFVMNRKTFGEIVQVVYKIYAVFN